MEMSAGHLQQDISPLLYLILVDFQRQSCSASLFKVHIFAFSQSVAAAVCSGDMASGVEETASIFIPCFFGCVYPSWGLFIDTRHAEDGAISQWEEGDF